MKKNIFFLLVLCKVYSGVKNSKSLSKNNKNKVSNIVRIIPSDNNHFQIPPSASSGGVRYLNPNMFMSSNNNNSNNNNPNNNNSNNNNPINQNNQQIIQNTQYMRDQQSQPIQEMNNNIRNYNNPSVIKQNQPDYNQQILNYNQQKNYQNQQYYGDVQSGNILPINQQSAGRY